MSSATRPVTVTTPPEEIPQVELSIVMPCLNEAETLGTCVRKALAALQRSGIAGEVIIADNGSTDGSQEIATSLGARVVPVEQKGYGSALQGGINAARGRYIVMGDSDDSHDYGDVPRFVEKLNQGYDMVVGNRFMGSIEPGAMSPLHRYLGTPVLTGVGKLFYKSPIGDFNCGLRGFTRDAWERLNLRSPGMEFASEMIVRAALIGLKVGEIPTSMAKDGRSREPHLRTWRDGWRHLRLLLLYSPRWVFLYPGIALLLLGSIGMLCLLPGPRTLGHHRFDLDGLLYAFVAILVGYQVLFFGAFSKILGITQGLLPQNKALDKALRFLNLESGLIIGIVATFSALVYLSIPISRILVPSAPVDPARMVRTLTPGLLMLTLGVQTIFSSFLLSMLGLVKRQ